MGRRTVHGRPSFAAHLIGSTAGARPPFFYAYAAFWLHLVAAAAILGMLSRQALAGRFPSLVVGSCSLAIVVYGARARRWGLLANICSYAVVMGWLCRAARLEPAVVAAAMIAVLGSLYLILAAEYRRRAARSRAEVAGWVSATMAAVMLALLSLALALS